MQLPQLRKTLYPFPRFGINDIYCHPGLVPAAKTLFSTSERPLAAVLADLTDKTISGSYTNDQEIDLRTPTRTQADLNDLEAEYARRLSVNEATLAPRITTTTDDDVELKLAVSSHSRWLAAAELFAQKSTSEQLADFEQYSTGTPPWLSHFLTVACSLETADEKLVWSVRPQGEIEGGGIGTTIAAAATPWDLINNSWDPKTTARRGFIEELGFTESDADELDFTFYAVISQFGNGGISVVGHAKTELLLQDVLINHYDALDVNEEVNTLLVVEMEREPFEIFLESNPLSNWTTSGAANLFYVTNDRPTAKLDGIQVSQLEAAAEIA